MNALLSGSRGTAVLLNETSYASLHIQDPTSAIPRQLGEVGLLLAHTPDLQILENIEKAEVVQSLTSAVQQDDALHLLLIALDPERSPDLRAEAAEELDELLEQSEISHHLKKIFFAHPLPQSADITKLCVICQEQDRNNLLPWLTNLQAVQPLVRIVWEAWESIPPITFDNAEQARKHFQAIGVQEGLFVSFVEILQDRKPTQHFFVNSASLLRVQSCRSYRKILQMWIAQVSEDSESIALKTKKDLSALVEKKPSKKRRKNQRAPIHRQGVLKKVENQIDSIRQALREGRDDRVSQYMEQLIKFQETRGGKNYTVKSLCVLAIEAKKLGLVDWQLQFSKKAIELVPEDDWSWRQYADALHQKGDYQGALEGYLRAQLYKNSPVAKNGLAETLRSMGRSEEALAIYQKTSTEHPGDVVAKNGLAETLRSMGRLEEALSTYQEVVTKYSGDVVAKSGLAETLRSMGRLEEALVAYQKTSTEHPEDVVAKSGLAEILRSIGRFEEALAIYQKTFTEHPEDVVAKSSLAETLRSMGRFEEALSTYQETVAKHPENVVAKNGLAETLRSMGRLEEALFTYQEVVTKHSGDVIAKSGLAETLRSMGRLEEALVAYQKTSTEHPEDVVAKSGLAETLRSMGRLEEALAAYQKTSTEHPEDIVAKNGLACVLATSGEWEQALSVVSVDNPKTLDGWIGYHIHCMILLRQGNNTDKAIKYLSEGLDLCPWPRQANYFRTALATAYLQKGSFTKINDLLEDTTEPKLKVQTEFIRVHTYGELQRFDEAKKSYNNIPEELPWTFQELQQELNRRYVSREGKQHTDTWVYERQVDCLMLAI